MGPSYISRVERGRTIPSVENVIRFAAGLGIPVHELFLEGGAAGSSNAEDSFVLLLSGYVRKMASGRRRMLMRLAERLARESRM